MKSLKSMLFCFALLLADLLSNSPLSRADDTLYCRLDLENVNPCALEVLSGRNEKGIETVWLNSRHFGAGKVDCDALFGFTHSIEAESTHHGVTHDFASFAGGTLKLKVLRQGLRHLPLYDLIEIPATFFNGHKSLHLDCEIETRQGDGGVSGGSR
jgi:hypothetical protein